MKARVPKEKELVLLYHLDSGDENGAKVRGLLGKIGIAFREVSEEMLAMPLGACAGLPGFQAAGAQTACGQPPEGGALIMAGFSEARMDALLAGLRETGARVRFKAVMTPHNRNWPFGTLLGELGKEERLMAAYVPMKKRLDRARALPEPERSALSAVIQRAQALADGKTEPTEERLRAADEALRKALEEA